MSRDPKHKPRSVYSSEKRLRAALAGYLLTNGDGEMGQLISSLVNFSKNRQVVKYVCTHANADHTRSWVCELLKEWEFEVVPIKAKAEVSETVHELRIPDIRDRRQDLPMMIAFYFEDFLHRNAAARLSLKEISLDLLWYMLGHQHWRNSDAIRAAVEQSITNAQGEVLTLCQAFVSAKVSFHSWKGGFGNACSKLEDPQRERKALGFLMNHPGSVEEDVRGKYVEWYLNWDTNEAYRRDFQPRVPRIPTNKLFQAMTNICKLSKFSQEVSALPQEELDKIEKCFSLRRQGLTEDEIADRLGMHRTHYQSWTESRSINIRFRQSDSICAGRHRAEASLLPPSKKDQNTLPYRENVLFDDKPRVVTIDGSPHELSPEQYSVYKCLVGAFPRSLTWREIQSAAGVSHHQQMAHTFARRKALRESIIEKIKEIGAKARWKAKLTET